ncbi:MAG: hypothetical protein ACYDEN_05840 [Acidimicrobiales bacterium]
MTRRATATDGMGAVSSRPPGAPGCATGLAGRLAWTIRELASPLLHRRRGRAGGKVGLDGEGSGAR